MVSLTTLSKSVTKKVKRLGRGEGSGRGKTSGRGTKGQKARGKIPVSFEGGQLSLVKRLPLYRGRGRNKPASKKALVINLKSLNRLPKNTNVTREILVKYQLIRQSDLKSKIKILGDGILEHALTVSLPTSKSAKVKIEKSGGEVKNQV